MEDWEVKNAYQILYEDLKSICQMVPICTDCPIKEVCDKCDERLYAIIKTAMENLYGKED